MSYLLYTSPEAATGLIPQPGRAVNTFPSGLVRVDQTYLGLTSNAAMHRAILAVGNDMPDGDTAPCIDGLKIFPEAQERRREDGFTEYIVSAYGRASSTGQNNSVLKRVVFQAIGLSFNPLAALPRVEFLYYPPVIRVAIPAGQIPVLSTQAPTYQIFPAESYFGSSIENQIAEMPANVREIRAPGIRWGLSLQAKKFAIKTFNPESLSIVYRVFSHRDQEIINLSSINFGSFDELVVEYDFPPFPVIGAQSDISMLDSNENLVGMVSSLFP